jgi:hypothetical protein
MHPRQSCAMAAHVHLRRLLRPFILKIHPDTLPSHVQAYVRQQNSACLMQLNSLLDDLQRSLRGEHVAGLPSLTQLRYYAHRDDNTCPTVRNVELRLPSVLCHRQNALSETDVQRCAPLVLKELERLVATCSHDGAEAAAHYIPDSAPNSNHIHRRSDEDQRAREAMDSILPHPSADPQSAGEARDSFIRSSLFLHLSASNTHMHRKRVGGQSVLQAHVESYMRSGKVLASTTHTKGTRGTETVCYAAQEAQTYERLRDGLCHWGAEVGFSLQTWAQVCIVIGPPAPRDYTVTERRGFKVLYVPYAFKTARLVRAILVHLPCTEHY